MSPDFAFVFSVAFLVVVCSLERIPLVKLSTLIQLSYSLIQSTNCGSDTIVLFARF